MCYMGYSPFLITVDYRVELADCGFCERMCPVHFFKNGCKSSLGDSMQGPCSTFKCIRKFLDHQAIIIKFAKKWHGVYKQGTKQLSNKHNMLNFTATRFRFVVHNNEYAHALTQGTNHQQNNHRNRWAKLAQQY